MNTRLVLYKGLKSAILNSLQVIILLSCYTLHPVDAGIFVRSHNTKPVSTLLFFATTTTASITIVEKPGKDIRNGSSILPSEIFFESQPALFGKPLRDGKQYKAHLQIVKLQKSKSRRDLDQFLCGGVRDEMDENSGNVYSKAFVNNKRDPFLNAIKNYEYEGDCPDGNFDCDSDQSSDMKSVAVSLFELQKEVAIENHTEGKSRIDGDHDEKYDVTVPKDGIPVALLVQRGQCSFEAKARAAMKLNAPSNLIQYLIIYDNEERETLVPMSANVREGINSSLLFCSLKTGTSLIRHILDHALSASDKFSNANSQKKISIESDPNDFRSTFIESKNQAQNIQADDYIDIEAGPIVYLDSTPQLIPSIYDDPHQLIIALLALFMILFTCMSCIFFCFQSGYVQVQDGVIIVGSRRSLPNGVGWGNNLNNIDGMGNVTGASRRLLTQNEVEELPEIIYQENSSNADTKQISLLNHENDAKNYSTYRSDGDMSDSSLSLSTKKTNKTRPTIFFYECKSCSVCLDEYVANDKLLILSCKHTFHKACIIPWLTERQSTCPLCKSEVNPINHDDNDVTEEDETRNTTFQSSTTSSPLSSSEASTSMSSSLAPSSSLNSSSTSTTDQDVEEQGEEERRSNRYDMIGPRWLRWLAHNRRYIYRDDESSTSNNNDSTDDELNFEVDNTRQTTPLLYDQLSPPSIQTHRQS